MQQCRNRQNVHKKNVALGNVLSAVYSFVPNNFVIIFCCASVSVYSTITLHPSRASSR